MHGRQGRSQGESGWHLPEQHIVRSSIQSPWWQPQRILTRLRSSPICRRRQRARSSLSKGLQFCRNSTLPQCVEVQGLRLICLISKADATIRKAPTKGYRQSLPKTLTNYSVSNNCLPIKVFLIGEPFKELKGAPPCSICRPPPWPIYPLLNGQRSGSPYGSQPSRPSSACRSEFSRPMRWRAGISRASRLSTVSFICPWSCRRSSLASRW